MHLCSPLQDVVEGCHHSKRFAKVIASPAVTHRGVLDVATDNCSGSVGDQPIA